MAGELSSIIEELRTGIEDAEIAALQRIEGEIKARIFQNGQAADGSQLDTFSKPSFGRYSLQWGLKRSAAGRGITVKDLEFKGDLRRAIAVGKSGNSNVIGFTFDLARLIAEGQEGQTRKKIWAPNDEEISIGIEVYKKRLFG